MPSGFLRLAFTALALAALGGCATSDTAASYASDPEFRDLAAQVCAEANRSVSVEEEVSGSNYTQDSGLIGRGTKILKRTTAKRWTSDAAVDNRGVLKWVEYYQTITRYESNSDVFQGTEVHTIVTSYSVPVHQLKPLTYRESPSKSELYKSENNGWRYASETTRRAHTVPLYFPEITVRVKHTNEHDTNSYLNHSSVTKEKQSAGTLASFNDPAAANQFIEKVNRLITLAKEKQ